MLTYSQRKSFAKTQAKGLEKTIDAALETVKLEREAEYKSIAEARKKAAAPVPFTRDELEAATHIRTDLGWHKVVRVNDKSVTVETGYSWTDRIGLAYIYEVRAVS